jgi:hypothetical protein
MHVPAEAEAELTIIFQKKVLPNFPETISFV